MLCLHTVLLKGLLSFAYFLGPKGVINDWRRFKLESMEQENLPAAKKELLRQMSSPNKQKDDSRANLNRKVLYSPFWTLGMVSQ